VELHYNDNQEVTMDGPRAPLESEFGDVVRFFSEQLRPDNAWSIADEYPLAIHPQNLFNLRIIKDNDRYLSGAVVKNYVIRTHAGLFKVAAIGSVVTHPSHRNQGLSTAILESSLQAAQQQNCDFAILWTDLYDYYRKIGFELAGTEVSLCVENEFSAPTQNLKIVESAKVAPEAILKLYAQHTCGALRTAADIRRFLTIPNMRIYTAWDHSNQITAYAVEGKGADLTGYIHEWGGSVPALMHLLSHIRKTQARPITIISPAHSQNLVRSLEAVGARRNDGVLGMIKLINVPSLITKVKRYARSLGLDELALEVGDGLYYFGQGDQIFQTDREADLIRLFFGPQMASQIHKFDPKTTKVLESIFPIPLWIWGWDSV